MKDAITKIKKNIEDKVEALIDETKKVKTETKNTLDSKTKPIEECKSQLEGELKELTGTHASLLRDSDKMKEKAYSLGAEYNAKQIDVESTKKELIKAENTVATLKEIIDVHQAQLEADQKFMDDKLVPLISLVDDKISSLEAKANQQEEIDQLTETIQATENKIQIESEAISKTDGKIEKRYEKIAKSCAKLEEESSKIFKAEFQHINRLVENTVQEINEGVNASIKKLEDAPLLTDDVFKNGEETKVEKLSELEEHRKKYCKMMHKQALLDEKKERLKDAKEFEKTLAYQLQSYQDEQEILREELKHKFLAQKQESSGQIQKRIDHSSSMLKQLKQNAKSLARLEQNILNLGEGFRMDEECTAYFVLSTFEPLLKIFKEARRNPAHSEANMRLLGDLYIFVEEVRNSFKKGKGLHQSSIKMSEKFANKIVKKFENHNQQDNPIFSQETFDSCNFYLKWSKAKEVANKSSDTSQNLDYLISENKKQMFQLEGEINELQHKKGSIAQQQLVPMNEKSKTQTSTEKKLDSLKEKIVTLEHEISSLNREIDSIWSELHDYAAPKFSKQSQFYHHGQFLVQMLYDYNNENPYSHDGFIRIFFDIIEEYKSSVFQTIEEHNQSLMKYSRNVEAVKQEVVRAAKNVTDYKLKDIMKVASNLETYQSELISKHTSENANNIASLDMLQRSIQANIEAISKFNDEKEKLIVIKADLKRKMASANKSIAKLQEIRQNLEENKKAMESRINKLGKEIISNKNEQEDIERAIKEKERDLESTLEDLQNANENMKKHEKKIVKLNNKIAKFNSNEPIKYESSVSELKELIHDRNATQQYYDKIKEYLLSIKQENSAKEQDLKDLITWYLQIEAEDKAKVKETRIYRDCIINVKMGNLVDERVDAIANPANEDCNHDDGISRELLEAGGEIINVECNSYLDKYQKLYTGKVMTTSGGALNCQHLIHVVGPIYRPKLDDSKDRALLREAIKSMFTEFKKNRDKSISFPAISTGIYRFPLQKCATTIGCVIKDYVDEDPDYFKGVEINLCNFDQKTTDGMIEFALPMFDVDKDSEIESNDESDDAAADEDEEEKEVPRAKASKDKDCSSEEEVTNPCIRCGDQIESEMGRGKYEDFEHCCYDCYKEIYKRDIKKYNRNVAKKIGKASKKPKSKKTKKKLCYDSHEEEEVPRHARKKNRRVKSNKR